MASQEKRYTENNENDVSETGPSLQPWNYNTRNNISFPVSKISLVYLMASINFTNNQNTLRRVIWGFPKSTIYNPL